MKRAARSSTAGFSLFEILIALGVFALAFMGLAMSLDSAITAGLEARGISLMRKEMDNRLAFCLAQPPQPGDPRVIEARENRGVKVEESLEPYPVQNREEEQLPGLWLLKITVSMDGVEETAETLLYIP